MSGSTGSTPPTNITLDSLKQQIEGYLGKIQASSDAVEIANLNAKIQATKTAADLLKIKIDADKVDLDSQKVVFDRKASFFSTIGSIIQPLATVFGGFVVFFQWEKNLLNPTPVKIGTHTPTSAGQNVANAVTSLAHPWITLAVSGVAILLGSGGIALIFRKGTRGNT